MAIGALAQAPRSSAAIQLRLPVSEDGVKVHRLVAESPPLDGNSTYCNLLQCTHFADTSVAAELDGALAGFISGYLVPPRRNTLFIWQVAVAESTRGYGLAKRMLKHILRRETCSHVKWLETTITPNNDASRSLFKSLARDLNNANCRESVLFDTQKHFQGRHESEVLFQIGPFELR